MSKIKVLVVALIVAIYLSALLWFFSITRSDHIQLIFTLGTGMGLFRVALALVRFNKSDKTKTRHQNAPHVPDHTVQDAQGIPHHQAHLA